MWSGLSYNCAFDVFFKPGFVCGVERFERGASAIIGAYLPRYSFN